MQLVEPGAAADGLLVLVDDDARHAQRGVVVLAHVVDRVEELREPVGAEQLGVGDDRHGIGGGEVR